MKIRVLSGLVKSVAVAGLFECMLDVTVYGWMWGLRQRKQETIRVRVRVRVTAKSEKALDCRMLPSFELFRLLLTLYLGIAMQFLNSNATEIVREVLQ